MKTDSHALNHQNQRMSMLSEKLRRSKIKSRGAPPPSDDGKTTASIIPKVVDLSPAATDMRYNSKDFPSSSSAATCETCEESASSPVPRKTLESSFFSAATPRRDNISLKPEASDDRSDDNKDFVCITPPTPRRGQLSDYGVTASPEIDYGNKTDDDDDDESLLDSVLNEEMEDLISIDGIHAEEFLQSKMYQGLTESVTAEEEDDYSSLLSESSNEFGHDSTDSTKEEEYKIDATGCKMSIDNRMAMIREKVTRLKNQSISLNQEPDESATSTLQKILLNGFIETDGTIAKRLDEVLNKVTEIQSENDNLKQMNKRLIAILETHGLSVLDQPLFMKDKVVDLSYPQSYTKDEAEVNEERSLDTVGSRKKDDNTAFEIKTLDEKYNFLIEESVNLQDERNHLTSKAVKQKVNGVESSHNLEKKMREKLQMLRVGSSEENEDLVVKLAQQRLIISSLQKQIKEQNISIMNLESHVRALNSNMMIAHYERDAEHEDFTRLDEEINIKTPISVNNTDWQQSYKMETETERYDDDSELESLTESERQKLTKEIEEERRLLMLDKGKEAR